MREYHKIDGLYKREEGSKRLTNEYRNPVVEYLAENEWIFTEKIDGTNIRVHWDGHRVAIAGRTDRANIPAHLMAVLEEMFAGEANEQVFEEHFGDKTVTLYGEGYGVKIQNGGSYRDDVSFILFDVQVGEAWLSRENVECVAGYFGIDVVPVIMRGTIQQAVDFVRNRPKSTIGTAKMEGLVGRPAMELLTGNGNRVVVKIKVRDFEEMDKYENA